MDFNVRLRPRKGEKMKENANGFAGLEVIPDSAWQELNRKRIYFGHQSVGYNILQGIRDLMKENPKIKLNIIETRDIGGFSAAVFGHFAVGNNTDPRSKIADFVKVMELGSGGTADIAFFKLCYIDFDPATDAEKIFMEYSDAMIHLKRVCPKTKIIHVTAPLVKIETGLKSRIKKIIKKPRDGIDGNAKRQEFNELLRKKYQGEAPIFDLAKIESTYPDGKRESFSEGGKISYAMVPAYTDDGGHLNEKGRARAATQLFILLASNIWLE